MSVAHNTPGQQPPEERQLADLVRRCRYCGFGPWVDRIGTFEFGFRRLGLHIQHVHYRRWPQSGEPSMPFDDHYGVC